MGRRADPKEEWRGKRGAGHQREGDGRQAVGAHLGGREGVKGGDLPLSGAQKEAKGRRNH